jgi:hypothetical protein
MADLNENDLLTGAHSPNFLTQRKIAYVDNPFDEQASLSMVQKCDIKYMNFPRNQNGVHGRMSGHDVKDKSQYDGGDEDVCKLGALVRSEGEDLASAEQDWSCLFSPVQVK